MIHISYPDGSVYSEDENGKKSFIDAKKNKIQKSRKLFEQERMIANDEYLSFDESDGKIKPIDQIVKK